MSVTYIQLIIVGLQSGRTNQNMRTRGLKRHFKCERRNTVRHTLKWSHRTRPCEMCWSPTRLFCPRCPESHRYYCFLKCFNVAHSTLNIVQIEDEAWVWALITTTSLNTEEVWLQSLISVHHLFYLVLYIYFAQSLSVNSIDTILVGESRRIWGVWFITFILQTCMDLNILI